jgi:predicted ester cyclase
LNTISDNKAIVRQFIETVVNTGDLTALEMFVAQDIIDHNSDGEQGIAAYGRHLAAVHHTYADFHVTIHFQIGEGEFVVSQVTAQGIHANEWLGLQPARAAVTMSGINIDRVVDGRIVEHWGEANTLAGLFQMGAKIVQER